MIRGLHIENIAVVKKLDIDLCGGLNVLTGETGAGKSIVIDAISAILGERAYRDMIRTGANKALVRAVFDRVPQLSWFEENGVPYEEELTLHREIKMLPMMALYANDDFGLEKGAKIFAGGRVGDDWNRMGEAFLYLIAGYEEGYPPEEAVAREAAALSLLRQR